MPIMAAQGRNDARIAAHLLVSVAKHCLEEPENAPSHAVVLNNVYRLLEAYRENDFFGLETAAGGPEAGDVLSLVPPLEEHVRDVRDVLEVAVATAFGGRSKHEAIDAVEGVLRGVAYPADFARPSDAERDQARRFFSEVLERLQTA